ncbi:hypothetical protein A1O1_08259 [Capronia coronata CBS 617.96]|uniref:Zn(2)-C6 fungal-type domain-containing protein n=1 Tax=Capronia coronata CBS 617.96 TaxID=1182541 RepID=W9XHW9_9EURO|nr:uncharacterized protein A1O1_08259 [Capronia coronata CBS 617.96]EXJ80117.1 hypothetical protein A1O1_08259 [Capronia coronata CBS 617.96]
MSNPYSALTKSGSPATVQDIDAAARRPVTGRRREKAQLSCNLCRRRKSRCDRKQPCSICSARGLVCTYADSKAAHRLMPKPPPTAMPSMHDRLVQLERLVLSLKSGSDPVKSSISTPSSGPIGGVEPSDAPGSQASLPTDTRSECGSMFITSSEFRYVGGDHWVAILDSIADLKAQLDRDEHLRLSDEDDSHTNDIGNAQSRHALLLYGNGQSASRVEILTALPPKTAVDRYISRYFNRLDSVAVSVHGPSFLREYEAFWDDPTHVPIAWIGLLFGMICLAIMISDCTDPQDTSEQTLQVDLYREKIVQCLFTAEYTSPGPYVLETTCHYVYIEFVLHADANKDVWLLLSLAVNLAKRMGYHRDPAHFPGISPLQAELRRRLWSTVLMSDVLVSSQMGMPRMVSDLQYDAAEPRNLKDNDLDGLTDNAELPPARPETEYTPTLNLIARRRVSIALGAVLDLTTAVKPCTHAEVMRADGILHAAAAQIPLPLKPKSIAASVTEPPQQIFARLFLQHLLYKGQIILHRRFLFARDVQTSDDLSYSRKSCLDAALGTLEIQHLLDEETQPAGVLYAMRRRVTSSMNHLFLTATVILCSLLDRRQMLGREEDMLAALRRARAIWVRKSDGSREAKKAAETVSIVLARVGEGGAADEDDGDAAILDLGSDFSTGPGAHGMFRETVEPALLGTLDQQSQNLAFSMTDVDMGAELDDWMFMNAPGTNWQ